MKSEVILSVQKLIQQIRELGDMNDLPDLKNDDLEKFSDEELQALELFLKKTIEGVGEFFVEYNALLTKHNTEYEKGTDEIMETEKIFLERKKMRDIQNSLKKKS